MTASNRSSWHVASRVAASLLGSYGFVWGFAALGVACCVALGMVYHHAETLFRWLAFLLFPACLCWAFVPRRLGWVWAALAGGGALMTLAAWLIAPTLVP